MIFCPDVLVSRNILKVLIIIPLSEINPTFALLSNSELYNKFLTNSHCIVLFTCFKIGASSWE